MTLTTLVLMIMVHLKTWIMEIQVEAVEVEEVLQPMDKS